MIFLSFCTLCKRLLKDLCHTAPKETLPSISCCMSALLKGLRDVTQCFSGRVELIQCFLGELGFKHSVSESSGSDSLLLAVGTDIEELAPPKKRANIHC